MPTLTKAQLFGKFADAAERSGLSILRLSPEGDHPAYFQIMGSGGSFMTCVYIWNLASGGRETLPDEWRIQVTGLPVIGGRQRFMRQDGGKTAVFGWCEELDVFAAFDVNRHVEVSGGSPSIQIRQPALEVASINGLAAHIKGEGEVAFAVRPNYLGAYLENMEELHACGSSEEAMNVIEEICKDPLIVGDETIEEKVPKTRRYSVASVRKALRDANFRSRVLEAYSNACAMCGVQLRLIDAAHILPAAHPDSTDEIGNGIALCALHHRAFDRGLVTFDSSYRVHRRETMERRLALAGLGGGLGDFQERLYRAIEVPSNLADQPKPIYIERVNAMRGWDL